MAGHSLGRDRPFLADLALLEWTHVELFDAADAEPLSPGDLQALAPDALAARPLYLVPAARRIATTYAIDQIWDPLAEGAAGATPDRLARVFLVSRQGSDTVHRLVGEEERSLLELVCSGTTFGLLCEALGLAHDTEEAATIAFQTLGLWLSEGLLARSEAVT